MPVLTEASAPTRGMRNPLDAIPTAKASNGVRVRIPVGRRRPGRRIEVLAPTSDGALTGHLDAAKALMLLTPCGRRDRRRTARRRACAGLPKPGPRLETPRRGATRNLIDGVDDCLAEDVAVPQQPLG